MGEQISILLVDDDDYDSGVQYCQELVAVGMLVTCWRKQHRPQALAWLRNHSVGRQPIITCVAAM